MGRLKECPKCGEDISHTFEPYDPSVGIMSGGWYCEACNIAVAEEDEQDWDDYDRKADLTEYRNGH